MRLDICALTTDIRVTIGPSVGFITVDPTYPWPSGETPPACPDVLGAILLTFDRAVQPPGSATPSPSPAPSPSAQPTYALTLQWPSLLPVRVFDLTGRLTAASESTQKERAKLIVENDPRLVRGPTLDTLIAVWMGGACDASTDLTIGPSEDQISVWEYQQPLPSPTDGQVNVCFDAGVHRFVTLTFASASSSPAP